MILEKGAPYIVNDTFDRYYKKYAPKGPEEARRRAIRHVNLAGYYRNQDGWNKKHDDLNEKVGICEAIKQDDGTYTIDGIVAFQPNSVKSGMSFTPEDVRKIIANTNRSINSGGQRPGVVEGHGSPEAAALGIQQDTHGFAVNWREVKGKPGWAECDLIGVEPEYVERMRKKKLSGLSIGIAKDAGNLNMRVGHLALLGISSAALSHLPASEIFDGGRTINYAADSIEAHFLQPKRKTMKVTDKHKEACKNLFNAYASFEAAEASVKASEPESQAKMGDAAGNLMQKFAACRDCFSDMEPGNMPGPSDSTSVDTLGKPAVGMSMNKLSDVNSEPTSKEGEYAADSDPFFRSDPEAAFAAEKNARANLERVVKLMEVKLRAQENKTKFENFSAQCESLRKEGRLMPDAKSIQEDFQFCFQTSDPDAALAHRLASYRSIPAQQTPATVNNAAPIFSAVDANPAKPDSKVSLSDMNSMFPEFDDEMMKFAALGANSTLLGRTVEGKFGDPNIDTSRVRRSSW